MHLLIHVYLGFTNTNARRFWGAFLFIFNNSYIIYTWSTQKRISSGIKLFIFLLLIFFVQKFVFSTPVISTSKTLFTIFMISYLFIAICSFFESLKINKGEILFYNYLRTFLYLQLLVMSIQLIIFFLGLQSNGKIFYSFLYTHMFFDFLPRVPGLFSRTLSFSNGFSSNLFYFNSEG